MKHAAVLVCQNLGNRFQPVLFENMAQIVSGFDSLEIYLYYHYILYLATNKNWIHLKIRYIDFHIWYLAIETKMINFATRCYVNLLVNDILNRI